ncbi:MAG: hypothetical protein IJ856_04240 [Candidatus Methanomethylophilaceae archaeon]|nr:hypothetical protein [Candidatus Methanomethylophilaceae archaeon]
MSHLRSAFSSLTESSSLPRRSSSLTGGQSPQRGASIVQTSEESNMDRTRSRSDR